MGGSSSKEPEDDRGVKGFFADIVAANRVAPYFRFEGCQLFFASISAGNLTDATYRCVHANLSTPVGEEGYHYAMHFITSNHSSRSSWDSCPDP